MDEYYADQIESDQNLFAVVKLILLTLMEINHDEYYSALPLV